MNWESVSSRRIVRWLCYLVAVAAGVAVIVVLFWPVTDLIARHDVGATGLGRAAALQSARDAARGRLLQLGAGLFAVGALFYTGRNFRLSRRTFELTEQGQVTDRYTKAIEQLGSMMLNVRIGGIYALERVARDSPRDHPTVIEVLAAFVREESSKREPAPPDDSGGTDPPMRPMRPDVQAALTVLGRRDRTRDRQRLSLAGADLSGADLSGGCFFGADFSRTSLYRARIDYADFRDATLRDADLSGAKLLSADLSAADLVRANLMGADLVGVNLSGANASEADFRASLSLIGAAPKLSGVELGGARWSADAEVPKGWQLDNRGRLKRAVFNAGDQRDQTGS